MGLFSFLTGSTKKTNLTPAEDYPAQDSLYFTSPEAKKGNFSLRELASRRLQGQDLGFGDGYLDKVKNPAIAQIDADFKERTLPTLSSEASKRGLARSSIVQDQIGRADQARNRDIESMVANFYQLNEMQKKTDLTEGINLASGLQDQQADMLNKRAAASERQVGRNIAGDQYVDANKKEAGGRIVSSLLNQVVPGSGNIFAPQQSTATTPTSNIGSNTGSINTKLLSSSDDELEQLYQALMRGRK